MSEAKQSSVRLENIDVLRGVASLAVCWFHLTNGYAEGSFAQQSGQYGWLGVEVFFVLSGFIIPFAMFSANYELRTGWKIFIAKRLLRIDPPYLVSIMLIFALWHLSALVPGYQGKPPIDIFSIQTFLHIGYLNGIFGYPWLNDVFWTLAIEFQFYLLISILYGAVASRSVNILIASHAVMLLGSFASDSPNYVLKYLALFATGIAVFQYRSGLIGSAMFVLLVGASTSVITMVHGGTVAFVTLVTGLSIAYGVNLGRAKPLLMLGAISFSLYLIHVPLGGRIVNFGRRYVQTELGEVLLSAIALVLCVISAYVFYICIERPSQRLAAKIKYQRNPPKADPQITLTVAR